MLASILELLGVRGTPEDPATPEAVREIVSRLDRLPAERARYVAAFAVVLSRVAHADLEIDEAERGKISRFLEERGHLSPEEAATATEIAITRSHAAGGTEHFLATREFGEVATREQKEDLLDCLFAVSAADGAISTREESQIRQIASELGFSHRELVAVRSRWNEYRDVLR